MHSGYVRRHVGHGQVDDRTPDRGYDDVNVLAKLVAGLVLSLAVGCANVTPPAQRAADPVDVYLTDYGVHSSLILPVDDDGLYVEYAFGDFGYAALNRDGPFDAVGALLFSCGSGIGRQYLRVPPGEDSPTLIYFPKKMRRLSASRQRVDQVLVEMNHRYDRAEGKPVYNDLTKITWRRDHQHYSLFNNCNQLTARQLRTLGYGVHGPVLSPAFKLSVGELVDPRAVKAPGKNPGGLWGSR